MNNQQDLDKIMQLPPGFTRQDIDEFLTPKRRAVVFALAEDGEDNQGELAAKIDSTVTSLANIIQKFEKAPFKLLESVRAGKYRRYRLTELGKSYVESVRRGEGGESGEDLDDGDRELFREAEISLACLRERYGEDDWQTKLDDALLWRIQKSNCLEDEAGEKLVNRYLACLERLQLRESYTAFDRVQELLEDKILKTRVNTYLKRFQAFVLLPRQLEDKSASFDQRQTLRFAFNMRDSSEASICIKAAGWTLEEYDKLKDAAKTLRSFTAEYSEKQIYLLFQGLLPELDDLSFYLTQLIHGQHAAEERGGSYRVSSASVPDRSGEERAAGEAAGSR